MTEIFDVAVMTIFAREMLEGSIIIGEYRTLILRSETWPASIERKDALRAVTVSAAVASIVALIVIAIVAIPLAVLSKDFDSRTALIIEGVSKIVAAVCILQLSLKIPTFLGIYPSSKRASESSLEDGNVNVGGGSVTLGSIRFNVAWNIWREVAECGIFLLPSLLRGEGIKAIPLSAVVGITVGFLCGLGIYYANKKLTSKVWLAVFTTLLLLFLSTGLFSGGSRNIEKATGVSTAQVWSIKGDFWSVNRLPMTILKPFGYSDTRTVLQIVSFWTWLAFGVVLHCRKYHLRRRQRQEQEDQTAELGAHVSLSEGGSSSSSRDNNINNSSQDQEVDIEMNSVEVVTNCDSGKVTLASTQAETTVATGESSLTETFSRFR
jgi:high-affinity iron transporter